jgi:ethanolamine utilization microcompartment shell protein EutL
MGATRDRTPGPLEEEEIQLDDRTADRNPTVDGAIRFVNGDVVVKTPSGVKSMTAGAAGGEANTQTNVGGGVELAKAKSGVDLPIRTLVEDGGLNISQETNTVELSVGFRRSFLLMGA